MTEVIRIPPFDSCIEEVRSFPGYSDRRGIEEIEREARNSGVGFSFEGTLRDLRRRFPDEENIRVFESGCGFGNSLRDIASLADSLSIGVQTTGITMAEEHIPADPAKEEAPDYLLVGTLHNHYKKKTLGAGYHFIFDFYGPLWYEAAFACRYPRYSQEGELTLPIYRNIAAGGAIVMMLMRSLKPCSVDNQSMKEYAAYIKKCNGRGLNYIHGLSFNILAQQSRYVLMQKEDASSLGSLVKAVTTLKATSVSFLNRV